MIPKFRVWDKKTKSMWNIERWHVEDEYFDLIEPNKSVADPNANRVWRKQSDVILMQSTGLKDKNGVEIYEGDIVELAYDFAVVKFDSGAFVVDCQYLDTELIYSIEVPIEVIGNVWENHELLEGATR